MKKIIATFLMMMFFQVAIFAQEVQQLPQAIDQPPVLDIVNPDQTDANILTNSQQDFLNGLVAGVFGGITIGFILGLIIHKIIFKNTLR